MAPCDLQQYKQERQSYEQQVEIQRQFAQNRANLEYYQQEYGSAAFYSAAQVRILMDQIEELKKENERLKNSIKKLKGGSHMEESQSIQRITSTLVHGGRGNEEEQISYSERLSDQVKFIKKSLDLSDEKIKKTKIKEIPDLIKKAENEITVGGMQELLEEKTREAKGVIKSILRFFLKMGK